MHELSIAQNILDIVRDYRPSDRPSQIRTVHLQLGDQSGVVPDSLAFCFKAITEGTPFEGAELAIERIPFSVRCRECGAVTSNEAGLFRCAVCEGTYVEIVSGTELQVAALEVVDEGAEA